MNPVSGESGETLSPANVAGRLAQARRRSIGFPVAVDIDYSPVLELHERFVNNIGDPESAGRWPCHTKDVEREVLAICADMFGGSLARSWGYVTAGGSTEGVLHGMWLGIERYPTARVYHSTAAHYCVPKAARLLRAPTTAIGVDEGGQMLYDDLARAVAAHPDQPSLVVATAGTFLTEAIDDIASVHEVLTEARSPARHIVVDAALAGPALALDGGPTAHLLAEHGGGSRADADSVCFSGHKSFGAPHVSGVALTRRHHVEHLARRVDYLDGHDTTIAGSRPGQAPVELLHALYTIGLDGLRARARRARDVADHTIDRLHQLGWPAWRHPHAWTVVLREPPPRLAARWAIPTSGGWAHIVCAPGITRGLIDEFVTELSAALRLTSSARPDHEERTA